jgi:hypothetical protein
MSFLVEDIRESALNSFLSTQSSFHSFFLCASLTPLYGAATPAGKGKVSEGGKLCECAVNCYSCLVGSNLEILPDKCEICKNSKVLHNSGCIEPIECSSMVGMAVRGEGKFNRRCIAVPDTADDENRSQTCVGKTFEGTTQACSCAQLVVSTSNCYSCVSGGGASAKCLVCKNARVLMDGRCVDDATCEDVGGVPTGAGNFRRTCNMDGTTTTRKPTTTITIATDDPCPAAVMDHFEDAVVGTRLKGANKLVLAGGGSIFSVKDAADCAAQCVGFGERCKAFEIKVRGGVLRCNLLSTSTALGAGTATSKLWDMYDRSRFCG